MSCKPCPSFPSGGTSRAGSGSAGSPTFRRPTLIRVLPRTCAGAAPPSSRRRRTVTCCSSAARPRACSTTCPACSTARLAPGGSDSCCSRCATRGSAASADATRPAWRHWRHTSRRWAWIRFHWRPARIPLRWSTSFTPAKRCRTSSACCTSQRSECAPTGTRCGRSCGSWPSSSATSGPAPARGTGSTTTPRPVVCWAGARFAMCRFHCDCGITSQTISRKSRRRTRPTGGGTARPRWRR